MQTDPESTPSDRPAGDTGHSSCKGRSCPSTDTTSEASSRSHPLGHMPCGLPRYPSDRQRTRHEAAVAEQAGGSRLRDDDILVFTEKYWPMPKRIAHKMPLAWAEAGNRVLWIEQPPFPMKDWRRPGQLRRSLLGHLERMHDRLWVGSSPPALPGMHRGRVAGHLLRSLHRPALLRRVRRYMSELSFEPSLVVLMQQAARYDVLSAYPDATSIYYCHDLFGYGYAPRAALAEEEEACRRVDQVWTTSEALRRRLAAHNTQTHHVPHAVDADWWDGHRGNFPVEYERIAPPRVVFTGVVQTEKIDLQLLMEVARLRPEFNFVFVGPLEVRSGERDLMDRALPTPNLHWLGARDLERLPGYIDGAQVLMLPYRTDSLNARFTGLSLKHYEYLISGKPVCATPFTHFETDAADLIAIADSADTWAESLDRLLQEADPDLARRRESLARRNTYCQRLEQQRALLAARL